VKGRLEFCVNVVEGLSVGLVVLPLPAPKILEVELGTDGNNVLLGEGLIKGVAT
jgi:hypothetical protein